MAKCDEIIILTDDDDEDEPKEQQQPTAKHCPNTNGRSARQQDQKAPTPASTNGLSPESEVLDQTVERVRNAGTLKAENAKLFDEFIDYCSRHTAEHPEVITFLKSRHEKANPDYLCSTEFRNVLGRCLTRVQNKKSKIYVYINELCTSLKANSQKKKVTISSVPDRGKETASARASSTPASSEAEARDEVPSVQDKADTLQGEVVAEEALEKKRTGSKRQIRYLENLLKVYSDEIRKLQEKELNLDELEDEDSSYIQENRLKKKMIKIFEKLCELKGCSSLTGRVIEQRIPYRGTRYPEVNRKIEKFINRPDEFPDYHDILKVIRKVNTASSLGLGAKQMQTMAQDAFREVGNRLQERRHLDLIYNFGSHLTDEYKPGTDPAMIDTSLERRLRENRTVAMKQLDSIIQKYAILQDDGEEEERKKKKQKAAAETVSSAASTKGMSEQVPEEGEISRGSKGKEADSSTEKRIDLEPASPEKTETKLKNATGSDRETEGEEEEVEEEEEDEASSDPDIEEELENSCRVSEMEEEVQGDMKTEVSDAEQELDNQSEQFGIYSGGEEVEEEDDDDDDSENEDDSGDEDEIEMEVEAEQDLKSEKESSSTPSNQNILPSASDEILLLPVKGKSLDSGKLCATPVVEKASLDLQNSSEEPAIVLRDDSPKSSEISGTILKGASASLPSSPEMVAGVGEASPRSSGTPANGLGVTSPKLKRPSRTVAGVLVEASTKLLNLPDSENFEDTSSKSSEASESLLKEAPTMLHSSSNTDTDALEVRTALVKLEASSRLRRSLSADFSRSVVSSKPNTSTTNRLRKRSSSDSRRQSSCSTHGEEKSCSENGGNIPSVAVNGREVDDAEESTPRSKKRKRSVVSVDRSDGVLLSADNDKDSEDISLDLQVTCFDPDSTVPEVDSTRANSPFMNVGSSSQPASRHRRKVVKVSVATQCDPEEVIVLSDSD